MELELILLAIHLLNAVARSMCSEHTSNQAPCRVIGLLPEAKYSSICSGLKRAVSGNMNQRMRNITASTPSSHDESLLSGGCDFRTLSQQAKTVDAGDGIKTRR